MEKQKNTVPIKRNNNNFFNIVLNIVTPPYLCFDKQILLKLKKPFAYTFLSFPIIYKQ